MEFGAGGCATRPTALRCAAPAIAVAVLVLGPFAGKAFTIDDSVFMLEARHALTDPLHPTAFEIGWGGETTRVSAIVPPGPVMAWLLTPAASSDYPEVVAHVTVMALLACGILATVSLATRLGLSREQATTAGLLLAAAPGVLGMAGTAMPDVPAMALGVAGLERLLAWNDQRRRRDAVFGVVLLAAASLARLHFVLLGAVAVLLALSRENPECGAHPERGARRRLLVTCAPSVAALALTVGVLLLVRDPAPAGGGVAGATAALASFRKVASNSVAFSVHWVLAIPLAIPWVGLRARRWVGYALLGAAGTLLFDATRGPAAPAALASVAALGLAALLHVFVDGWHRRDRVQLALGAWLLVPLSVVVYAHLPSKYLLASAPAAAILVSRRGGSLTAPQARALIGAVACAGVLLGVAILRADSSLAGLSRAAARELIAPATADGERVWYLGRWGFQWYAEAAGARALDATSRPSRGDLIVTSVNSHPGPLARLVRGLPEVARMEDRRPGGRLMSYRDGAGFYSNSWGYLPWAWGRGPVDVIEVRRIPR